jgi:transcriptional regulator
MRLNQTDLKILKLHRKGMKEADIDRKIGYSDLNAGLVRVREALERAKKLGEV